MRKNEDTCVCCGEYVPEGQQVCRTCEHKAKQKLGYAPQPYWKQCLYIIRARFRRRRK